MNETLFSTASLLAIVTWIGLGLAAAAPPGKMPGGWVHFLAFDLLVGWWIVDDTLSRGRSRLPLFVVLPATFMYGPVGLLLQVFASSFLLVGSNRSRAMKVAT
jgi:Domain of unknown function (DUF4281)